MPDRLSPLDVSFLYLEESTTPMHVGSVAIFRSPKTGFDHDRLVDLIGTRIAFVPRYRQRVRWVPGRMANPVWVDDERFDLSYHVRRSALPRPGSVEQLAELVARVQSRPLDRHRPLWEMYLVEGLSDRRFALITKTHHAMIDGIAAVDIGQVILDTRPDARDRAPDTWRPAPEPSPVELMAGAIAETVRRPTAVLDAVRGGVSEVRHTVGRLAGAAGGLLAAATSAARSAPESPLNTEIGEQRRYAMVALDLDDHRRVRKAHDRGGEDVTVNDVVLATIAGALRAWLLTRGEKVAPSTTVRALVPVSVSPAPGEAAGAPVAGNRVASYLVELPVGEPSPVMRLHQVAYATQAHKDTGRAIDARSLSDIAGFAPTTLHALGVRVSSEVLRRQHDVLVTNVPGPQMPLYAAGERLVASYPVLPLGAGHLLAIGVTSYDGQVFFGLTADRDAVGDLDVLAQCLDDAVEELLDTTVRSRSLRQPTRKASAAAKKAAASKAAARQEARRGTGQRRAAMRNLASRAVELGTSATRVPGAKRTVPAPAPSTARKLPTTAPEPPAKKAPAEQAPAKKAPAKKAPTKKAPAKKTPAKKAPAMQTPAVDPTPVAEPTEDG